MVRVFLCNNTRDFRDSATRGHCGEFFSPSLSRASNSICCYKYFLSLMHVMKCMYGLKFLTYTCICSLLFNPSEPSGYSQYQLVQRLKICILHSVFVCYVWILEQKGVICLLLLAFNGVQIIP